MILAAIQNSEALPHSTRIHTRNMFLQFHKKKTKAFQNVNNAF